MALDARSVNTLASGQVLVAGDSMLDRYWFGDVERISPEAPVPVMRVTRKETRLGGAANVASNVVSLGGKATLLSMVGKDGAADELEQMLSAQGIVPELVGCEKMETTTKLRMLGRNQQLLRADFETVPSEAGLADFATRFDALLADTKVVVVSDYGKGSLQACEALIEAAKKQDVAALVDPKSKNFARYRGAALVTPNLAEFQAATGDAVWGIDDIQAAAEKLMVAHDIGAILVTLSERGMALCEPGQTALVQSARAREVYDVTGAGDTVIAVTGLGLAAGFSLVEAVELANHAAGIVVTKLGTACVSADELGRSLSQQ